MATTKKTTTGAAVKKPAAKTTAVKKPAAKATAVKKPAAKKPAVKKPAVKKPVVKKPAAKKTAAKAPAAKKPAAKKPAVKKPAVKKPVVKKPAAKTTAVKKTAAKTPAVKKPAAKAPAAKKPAVKTTAAKKPLSMPVEALDPKIKFRNLFDAYSQQKLPFAHGYIVSSFFSPTTAYSIYEIVSYAGVKEIFMTETGLQFITGGKKLYVLLENDTYEKKFLDPVSRVQGESIPKRFSEVETIIARNQTRMMIAKEPNELYGSFTILKPSSLNFSIVFYQLPDVYTSIANFFTDSFNRQRKIPHADAKKAALLIASIVEKTMGFKGQFA